MRAARAADFRRRATTRPFPVTLREVEFRGMRSLGSGTIEFSGAPAVLCGGNGVGKTTILDAIFTVLAWDAEQLPPRRLARLQGEIRCRVDVEGTPHEFSARVSPDGVERTGEPPNFEVTLVDPAPQCHRWLSKLEGMANFDELLEALDPATSGPEELAEVSYLVGKSYEARSIYEIEEFEERLPYVTVRIGETAYQFGEMGLGELALNVMHWQLANAPRRSLVLIEEPETYVSPRSQRRLIDVLCRYSVEREFFPVITTHSWGIAGRLPLERTILMHGAAGGTSDVGILQPPHVDQLNDVLAVPHPRSTVLLVEDEAAEQFGRALLDAVDPSLLSFVEFSRVGDAGQIEQILHRFPPTTVARIIGLYDGGYEPVRGEAAWPHRFLPGARPPEGELRGALNGRLELVATIIGRNTADIRAAQAGLEGEDDHDWLTGLADRLNKQVDMVVAGLAEAWLDSTEHRRMAEQLATDIRELSSQVVT